MKKLLLLSLVCFMPLAMAVSVAQEKSTLAGQVAQAVPEDQMSSFQSLVVIAKEVDAALTPQEKQEIKDAIAALLLQVKLDFIDVTAAPQLAVALNNLFIDVIAARSTPMVDIGGGTKPFRPSLAQYGRCSKYACPTNISLNPKQTADLKRTGKLNDTLVSLGRVEKTCSAIGCKNRNACLYEAFKKANLVMTPFEKDLFGPAGVLPSFARLIKNDPLKTEFETISRQTVLVKRYFVVLERLFKILSVMPDKCKKS